MDRENGFGRGVCDGVLKILIEQARILGGDSQGGIQKFNRSLGENCRDYIQFVVVLSVI